MLVIRMCTVPRCPCISISRAQFTKVAAVYFVLAFSFIIIIALLHTLACGSVLGFAEVKIADYAKPEAWEIHPFNHL